MLIWLVLLVNILLCTMFLPNPPLCYVPASTLDRCTCMSTTKFAAEIWPDLLKSQLLLMICSR